MKQPDLGKRILELRKQKGLTQEELVEKCNINVRTIQRIEAGETMPRSFTIKTILQALDATIDLDEFTKELVLTNQDKKKLNLAWFFGIIYFVFGFVETIADVYQFTKNESNFNVLIYVSIKVVSSVAFVLFFMGFLRIAKIYAHKLLEVVVYVFMLVYVLFEFYDIFLISFSKETIGVSLVAELLVFGVIQIIFGIGLLQLKSKLGTLVQVCGVLEIITGALLATIVLASLGLFLLIPTIIIEIIIVYKLARK
ncbi:conserved membrane hypothetical protein [Tenacibaculum sediminilitoris]|uniref:helix-turn-helix domain-containing protein n=1 Tax=Tenacibaculum sediminilitoris TaxID=1820334 RepID=UPI00389330B8